MFNPSLNPCLFCASAGSSGDSCSCWVVTEFIVFVLSTPRLVSSCGSSLLRYLCLLDRNRLVAAESGCPCGMLLLFMIDLKLDVGVDRRDILLLSTVTTTAAYNICYCYSKLGCNYLNRFIYFNMIYLFTFHFPTPSFSIEVAIG